MFLRAQFSKVSEQHDDNKTDWLEHESMTLVMSDLFVNLELNKAQVQFLFETLMAAQMCQLAMVVSNHFKAQLSDDEFKTQCGLVYQQLGDYDMAKSMLEEAIEINPANPMLICHLGFNHLFMGESDKATNLFKRATEIAPEFIAGYQNLAGLYYQAGDFELAANYAEQAYACDKSLVSTYVTAISAYLVLGNKDKAEQWINAAIDNQVSSIELVRLAGISAHQHGRLDEALEALDHYLAINPSSYDVLNIRTRVKVDLGQYQDLEADLKQLLSFEPHDEWCLEQLFLCYFHSQQWADAQRVMVELSRLTRHYKITYREQINTINKHLSLNVLEIS
ncbi:TPR domain protein [Photobacterium aphoticum]|uniref:TPR domain protein n=1 Tax=Photobacterium aphoticum TaxID=754436 RepID=A0A090QPT8_9GAMM|nr:TPR domain protein [Photobacterium aphoticum]